MSPPSQKIVITFRISALFAIRIDFDQYDDCNIKYNKMVKHFLEKMNYFFDGGVKVKTKALWVGSDGSPSSLVNFFSSLSSAVGNFSVLSNSLCFSKTDSAVSNLVTALGS